MGVRGHIFLIHQVGDNNACCFRVRVPGDAGSPVPCGRCVDAAIVSHRKVCNAPVQIREGLLQSGHFPGTAQHGGAFSIVELLLHGVNIGITILNQTVEEIGCFNALFTVHIAVGLGTVFTYKVSAVGNPELLQHIGKSLALIHDDVGSGHIAGGQLPGNVSKLRPGQGVLHLIRHGDAGRVSHIFIVVQCHGTLCCSQGVQLAVIGSLHFDRFHEIT